MCILNYYIKQIWIWILKEYIYWSVLVNKKCRFLWILWELRLNPYHSRKRKKIVMAFSVKWLFLRYYIGNAEIFKKRKQRNQGCSLQVSSKILISNCKAKYFLEHFLYQNFKRAKILMIFFNIYYEINTKHHLITILGAKLKFFKKNSNHWVHK